MLIIPRAGGTSGAKTFGTSSIGRRVDNDTLQEQSEIERKYAPARKKLENIYRDIDVDIKYIKRRGKEIMEQYPQKTNTEIEVMNTVSSLQSTKLQTVKAMMAIVKDTVTLENSRMELFAKHSGGKIMGKDVGGSIHSAATIAKGSGEQVRAGEIGNIIPSYGNSAVGIGSYGDGVDEYVDDNYFGVDEVSPKVVIQQPTQPVFAQQQESVEVGGDESPSLDVVQEEEEVVPKQREFVQHQGDMIVAPKTSGKFVSILDGVDEPEKAKYLHGSQEEQHFSKLNDKLSYGTAAATLRNNLVEEGNVKKMHYDYDHKVGWLRTYDANGDIVESESLTPLSMIDAHVGGTGSTVYATDRFNNNYDVIEDSVENMPEVLQEELKVQLSRK